ncbi:permease [Desulfuribacillus stibiiarsenatis]|uniref:Probable membrane transporter protein n=1 Tax=Desulfuribacillus stibiiarsenatis TaxID=1390249 RepID=A0A1E5LAJ7_9FIRM|nr:sulfite exporter TauE/SafE family protein [Desulfuribacillus stibiiarsenatis]OEH87023.1 permease [Desulfuribacillus stibiiarsenatis]
MKRGLSVVIGFITGIVNGLLGVGGTILVPAMIYFLDTDRRHSHGTALLIIFPTSLVSTFVYYQNNNVDINLAWKLAIGGIVGSYIGAKALRKLKMTWVKRIFAIVMIAAGIRMVMG